MGGTIVIPISVTVVTTFIITYIKHEGNNTRDIKYMIPTQQTELLERQVILLDSNYSLLNQKVNHVEKELNIQKNNCCFAPTFINLLPFYSQLSIDLKQPNDIYLYRVTDETGKLLGEGKFVIVH
jgi:hypothetical protein